ncbi:hypothetical protein E2C01_003610 [Portunus trituberculatus]|uniref:Uncharacterized protein n=1 Tax=Portunus trituberculatus TaxID=210409 RepID=A0A5B7CU11_PORTR|nr:hypothetical protein [Portunus trituberculatus]
MSGQVMSTGVLLGPGSARCLPQILGTPASEPGVATFSRTLLGQLQPPTIAAAGVISSTRGRWGAAGVIFTAPSGVLSKWARFGGQVRWHSHTSSSSPP